MIERIHSDDTVIEELEQHRQDAERLRWINAHIREASEADLIEDAADVDEEEAPPPSGER